MYEGIIKNIDLNLNINAKKRVEGNIDVKLYSKDIGTGVFEFTFLNEKNQKIELDSTYSSRVMLKFNETESVYIAEAEIVEGIARFVFPNNFITHSGLVTLYIYLTKDDKTSDVAAITFNVYKSEIDEVAKDVIAVYDKNYEDILTEFEQALVDYKLTLPKADSVRADIDAILNSFSEDSQTKLNQFDIDAQLAIADLEQRVGPQGIQGPKGEQGPQGLPGKDGLNADLTEVQTMIDTAVGDIESVLSQIIGGA